MAVSAYSYTIYHSPNAYLGTVLLRRALAELPGVELVRRPYGDDSALRGSLSFVRDNMKTAYRGAFMPRNLRNAEPIGGASLVLPKGNPPERQAAAWTLQPA